MDNMVVWADIPVTDLERAMKFYGAVLQHQFVTIPGMEGVGLPAPDQPPGEAPPAGAMPVALRPRRLDRSQAEPDGCTIYLNAEDGPEAMMERAAAAGGEILTAVADMGEMVGFIGFFKDSEGNRDRRAQDAPAVARPPAGASPALPGGAGLGAAATRSSPASLGLSRLRARVRPR